MSYLSEKSIAVDLVRSIDGGSVVVFSGSGKSSLVGIRRAGCMMTEDREQEDREQEDMEQDDRQQEDRKQEDRD